MRKITCLLIALLCSFASVVSAQSITSLDDLSNSKAFTIRCGRGYLYANSGHTELVATRPNESPTLTLDYKFVLYKHTDNKYYLYNLGAGKFVQRASSGEGTSLTTSPDHELQIIANEKGQYKDECPWFLAVNGQLLNNNGQGGARTNYGTTALEDDKVDQGNQWALEVPETDAEVNGEAFSTLLNLSNSKAYYILCNRGYMYSNAEHTGLKATKASEGDPELTDDFKFVVYKTNNDYYLCSVGAGKFVQKSGAYTSLGLPSTPLRINIKKNTLGNDTYSFTLAVNGNLLNNNNDHDIMTNWEDLDEGNQWTFVEAGDYTGGLNDDKFASLVDASDYVSTAMNGYSIGSGYNSYSYAAGTTEDNKNAAVAAINALTTESSADEIAAAKSGLQQIVAGLTINQPANGSFIRIRSTDAAHAAMPYLTSINSTVNETRAAYYPSTSVDYEATIFYYANNNLLAYGTGYYLANNSNFAGYNGITEGTVVAFRAATNGTKGQYNVTFNNGNRYLYAQENNGNYYTDAGGTGNSHARYNFWLEEVSSLPVSISAAGYATLIAPVALAIPENVKVYTATLEDTKAVLTELTEGVIPANTGVVLEGAEGTYNFTITTTEEQASSDLQGQPQTVNAAAGTTVFALGNKDGKVAFYRLEDGDGADRTIKGMRAYFETETPAQAISLDFGAVTGIDGTTVTTPNNANAPIYDLSGRRVMKAQQGIYIQNGRKIYVK